MKYSLIILAIVMAFSIVYMAMLNVKQDSFHSGNIVNELAQVSKPIEKVKINIVKEKTQEQVKKAIKPKLDLLKESELVQSNTKLIVFPTQIESTEKAHIRRVHSAEEVPEHMHLALGLSDEQSVWKRLEAVSRFNDELSAIERESFYWYLDEGPNERADMAVKNTMLNILRNQKRDVPGLTNLMLNMINDKEGDPGHRAYVVQHLTAWKEDVPPNAKIDEAIIESASEFHSVLGPTALLCLTELQREGYDISTEEIGGYAAALVVPEADGQSITTGIQVLADQKDQRALPAALRELSGGLNEVGIPQKLSAISAIGKIGGEKELELLEDMNASQHAPIYKLALNKAIENLGKKIQ